MLPLFGDDFDDSFSITLIIKRESHSFRALEHLESRLRTRLTGGGVHSCRLNYGGVDGVGEPPAFWTNPSFMMLRKSWIERTRPRTLSDGAGNAALQAAGVGSVR